MIEVVDFVPLHAEVICDLRDHYGMPNLEYPVEKLIAAYMSPGSHARTLTVNGMPCASAGIINLGWRNGEAWLLDGPYTILHPIALVKAVSKGMLDLAKIGDFRRVQATCFTEAREKFFRLLGFDYETSLRSFGPQGQTAYIYSRIFQ
jgi:hypothetical protein